MHFTGFLAAQLRAAGVAKTAPPDLAWFDAPIEKFSLPSRYAVLIPGCSPDAPHKRWPPHAYAESANRLIAQGLPCVTVGTSADADALNEIRAQTPSIIDLGGQTSLFELAGVLRRAICVIGNDTGPLHLAAALGAPTLALFSGKSNPVWSAPPGTNVVVKQSRFLNDLPVTDVLAAFEALT
jgi:ADP-heptose:LPS heptosyltransferase